MHLRVLPSPRSHAVGREGDPEEEEGPEECLGVG